MLTRILSRGSHPAMEWRRAKGSARPDLRPPAFRSRALQVWRLTVEAWGGGPGLVDGLTASAKNQGIDILYETRATGLVSDGPKVTGVRVKRQDGVAELQARAVVLACGGFESNAEWRTRYLGPGWSSQFRGTRLNNGEDPHGIDLGASPPATGRVPCLGGSATRRSSGSRSRRQLEHPSVRILGNARGERSRRGRGFRNYTYAVLAAPSRAPGS